MSDKSLRTSSMFRSLLMRRSCASKRGSRTSLDNGRFSSRPSIEYVPRREWASTARCSRTFEASYVPTKSEYASVRIEKNSTSRSASRLSDSSEPGSTIELHGLINKRMRIPSARRIWRSISSYLVWLTHLSLWVNCLNKQASKQSCRCFDLVDKDF